MRHLRTWLVALALGWAGAANAHIASNGFLTLAVEGGNLDGSIELTLRDAELAIGLDSDHDGRITWGEVRSHQRDLEAYVRSRLFLGAGPAHCAQQFGTVRINQRVDGNYLWLPFTAACRSQLSEVVIDYRILQGIDPSHRGLLSLSARGGTQTAVLVQAQ